MNRQVDEWANDRLDKLEKRLKHCRGLGETLVQASTLKLMNDRAVDAMETKLFELKRQHAGVRPGPVV